MVPLFKKEGYKLKNILKLLKYVAMIFIGIIMLFFITRAVVRVKIKDEHEITTPNGINEEVIVEIGGINQYLYIRGQEKSNPVILILHGGPGSPLTPIIYTYQDGLEKDYTVVNWDQRNSGKTYYLNNPDEVYDTLSMDRMLEDTKEIIEYLNKRYNKDKIIILGHSWGTALGTEFIKRYPELVSAYIGVGQMINAVGRDRYAFETTREAIINAGASKDLEIIEGLDGYLLGDKNFTVKAFSTYRGLSNKYLGRLPDKTLKMIIFSPYYTVREDLYFLNSSFKIHKPLMDYLTYNYDARKLGIEYKVPVYYIFGDSDYITPTKIAQDFFLTINAPKNEIKIIKNAGHMTMLDNPKDFINAVLEVLK